MSSVLVKDEWLDRFYDQFVFVKDVDTKPEFYLDRYNLECIVPELIHNDKIQYHKISLIHILKIYHMAEELRDVKKENTMLSHQIGYLWCMIVIISYFIIF